MPEVIYYSAVWCSPCKVLYPQVERVCQQEGATIRKIDIDKEPQNTPNWLTSIPTMVVGETVLTGMTANPTALRKVLKDGA